MFERAINRDPTLAAAYVGRAYSYFREREYNQAIADCKAAIDIDPDYALAYNVRGTAHEAAGDLRKALEDFSSAIQKNGKDASFLINRGRVYWKLAGSENDPAHYRRSVEDFTRAIELKPPPPILARACNGRGMSYSDSGEIDKAIDDYTRAIELQPEYASAWYNRYLARRGKGQFDDAERDRRKAIELDPSLK
jgi:tetratricopeptide (TPR) repeat protein